MVIYCINKTNNLTLKTSYLLSVWHLCPGLLSTFRMGTKVPTLCPFKWQMQRCRFGVRRFPINRVLLSAFLPFCFYLFVQQADAACCMLHVARCTLLVAAATFILFVAFCFAECEILIAKRAVSVFMSLSFFSRSIDTLYIYRR